MRKLLAHGLVLLALALTGCAGMRKTDPFLQIQPGMEAFEVQQVLGDPVDRRFVGNHQEWVYRKQMGKDKDDTKNKIIVFDGEKVVAMADDEVAAERQFELARARAEAPRYFEPPGLTRGTSSGYLGGGLLCTDHNKYGDFASGGGCNEYGCWAPGGSCNKYGCALRGECSEKGCKDKAPSYQCVKR